jgi:hypothetical protein
MVTLVPVFLKILTGEGWKKLCTCKNILHTPGNEILYGKGVVKINARYGAGTLQKVSERYITLHYITIL